MTLYPQHKYNVLNVSMIHQIKSNAIGHRNQMLLADVIAGVAKFLYHD